MLYPLRPVLILQRQLSDFRGTNSWTFHPVLFTSGVRLRTAVNKKSLTHFHKCANVQWSWIYLKDELSCLLKPNTKLFLECHTDSNKHQGIVQYCFYIQYSTEQEFINFFFFFIDPCISVHFVLFPPLPSALHLSISNENSYIFSYKTCRTDCGYYKCYFVSTSCASLMLRKIPEGRI